MKGHILILVANILFGVSMPVFKFLLTSNFPPEAITYMRAAFACVMFWIASCFIAPKEKVRPGDLGLLFFCGLCGVGFNQWLFVIGLKASSPVDASIIATAVPIFVLLLAAVVLREPITTKKSLGVFIGASGGLLLVYSSAHTAEGSGSLWGDTLMLMNQLLYSFYLVLSNELYALLYLLIGATFLSFMLIPMALKYIRTTTASMYNYIQPIIASIIAISIGQDTFSLQKLMSAVLVSVGVYLVAEHKKKESVENSGAGKV